jgi:hypothetical protein
MEEKNDEPIFEFRGEEIEFVELTSQQEKELNEYLGIKGAICLDGKTKIIDKDKVDVNYGKVMDIAGNIVDAPPVDKKLYNRVNNIFTEEEKNEINKNFVRNSIFH